MINILFNTKDKRKTPVFFNFTLYENLDDVKKSKSKNYIWEDYGLVNRIVGNPKYDLPKQMIMVTNCKSINFDFYNWKHDWKIFSEEFLNFVKEQGLPEENYQISKLHTITSKGEEIVNKKYYILRIHKFDDALFNFDKIESVPSKSFKGAFFYPKLDINEEMTKLRGIFFLDSFCYSNTIILTNNALKIAKELNFQPMEYYSSIAYIKAYNQFFG